MAKNAKAVEELKEHYDASYKKSVDASIRAQEFFTSNGCSVAKLKEAGIRRIDFNEWMTKIDVDLFWNEKDEIGPKPVRFTKVEDEFFEKHREQIKSWLLEFAKAGLDRPEGCFMGKCLRALTDKNAIVEVEE